MVEQKKLKDFGEVVTNELSMWCSWWDVADFKKPFIDPINPFEPEFTIVISSTTSRELLPQFLTCSGWRWFEKGEKSKKIVMYW